MKGSPQVVISTGSACTFLTLTECKASSNMTLVQGILSGTLQEQTDDTNIMHSRHSLFVSFVVAIQDCWTVSRDQAAAQRYEVTDSPLWDRTGAVDT